MELIRETRTARVERTPAGIVVTRIKAGVKQVVSDAVENLSISAQASNGKLAPLLVDIREAAALDAEPRHYYTGKRLDDSFSAFALLVVIGAFGKMMGNIYLRVAKPGIPARLFTSEEEALRWLESHLS